MTFALVFTMTIPYATSAIAETDARTAPNHKSTNGNKLKVEGGEKTDVTDTSTSEKSLVKVNSQNTTLVSVPASNVPSKVTKATKKNERDVYDWNQFYDAMMSMDTNVIHIQSDFYNTKTDDASMNDTISTPMRPLKIVGNGHTIDFRGASFFNDTALKSNERMEWEIDHLTMYGQNSNGPIKTASDTTAKGAYGALIYKDVSYIGAQLTASYNWMIDFRGHIENHSVNSYQSPFDHKNYNAQINQVNIEAKDVVFREGNYYRGTTENAGVFHLAKNGQMTLEDKAEVHLTAGGNTGEFSTYALYLQGDLVANKDSKLSINTTNKGKQYGLYLTGKDSEIVAADEAKITITSNGESYPSLYLESGTGISIKDKAALNILAENKGNSTYPLINIEKNTSFVIGEKGIFNIVSDGYGAHDILKFGTFSKFQFTDAEKVNLQFTNADLSPAAKLIEMDSGNLEGSSQTIKAWNLKNISQNNTKIADFQWNSILHSKTAFEGNNSAVKSVKAATNQMDKDYVKEFKPEKFSRLMYSDVKNNYTTTKNKSSDAVTSQDSKFLKEKTSAILRLTGDEVLPTINSLALTNIPSDLVTSEDSQVVRGKTTPGAYVRVTGDPALPTPSLSSEVEGEAAYSTKADSEGNFEVKAEVGKYFIASNTLKVFASLNGQQKEINIPIADKTAPTAEGKTLAIVKGDKLPNALDFLSHVKDSNPANFSITHVYFADYSK
ncbi:MAG: hypothetical protein KBT36_12500, partial [Kurthia sp.]|nr:hypothetical protein [Candidatus Kurthia equi]